MTPASIPDREWMSAITVGAFVRARRRANGMSQRELAELAGVGTRFISELENGKKTLRMDAVNAVLGVFGKRLGVVDAARSPDEAEETRAE